MIALSEEHTKFQSTQKCPMCGSFQLWPRYIHDNGSEVPSFTALEEMDPCTVAACSMCGKQWYVFAMHVRWSR